MNIVVSSFQLSSHIITECPTFLIQQKCHHIGLRLMLGFRDVSYVWLLHRSMSQGDFPTYCHFGSLVYGDFGRNRSVRTNQ